MVSSASNKLAFVHDCGLEDVTRGNVLPRGEDATNKGTLLHCSFPGKEGDLILSTEGIGRFRKGEEIGLSFKMEHVCLFDPEDGHSLL